MRDCFELAGLCGLAPEPRTLRELLWASQAHRRDEWDRWSTWLAMYSQAHGVRITAKDPRINPFADILESTEGSIETSPGAFSGTLSQMKEKFKGVLHAGKRR